MAGYTRARRKKAAKKAWATRRERYGYKGYKNKPGPKGKRGRPSDKVRSRRYKSSVDFVGPKKPGKKRAKQRGRPRKKK